MTITTYTGEGYIDVRDLIKNIVQDLLGQNTPAMGTAAEHMRLIFPATVEDITTTGNITVILEATPAIDPFSPPENESGPQYDPWRIAFQAQLWQNRSLAEAKSGSAPVEVKDTTQAYSLAVYLGTPATLTVNDSAKAEVAWKMTKSGVYKLPFYRGYPTPGSEPAEWKYKLNYVGKDFLEPLGNTGAEWTNTFDPSTSKFQVPSSGTPNLLAAYNSPAQWDGPDVTDPNQLFVNKWLTAGNVVAFAGSSISAPRAVPNSYRLTLSDHGLFLGVWGPDPEEAGSGFSWLLAQRPVDKEDGIVRGLDKTTGLPYDGSQIDPATGNPYPLGNRPLFCVNSTNGKFYKFTVREHDNPIPTNRKDASRNTTDNGAVINPYQQQSLTENGEYVITFLNNLNSSRFKYSDELDMVGTVSSDVVGGGSNIEVGVYTEAEKRTYHALWSSGAFGTRMRIMVVEDTPTPNNPALTGGGEGGGG